MNGILKKPSLIVLFKYRQIYLFFQCLFKYVYNNFTLYLAFYSSSFYISYTFERVQENSEKLWRFERYTVINDYDWRIPSPINLIFLPYRICCCPAKEDCCLQKCRGKYSSMNVYIKKCFCMLIFKINHKNECYLFII